MMRTISSVVLAGLATFAVLSLEPSSPSPPQFVLTVRSLDSAVEDWADLARLAAGPLGSAWFERIQQEMARRGVRDAIDVHQPWGLYASVTSEGAFHVPILAVPVKEAEVLRRLLRESLRASEVEPEDEGGVYRYLGRRVVYVRFAHGYAYVSGLPSALKEVPEPALFATKHDCELRFYVAGLPEEMRGAIADAIAGRLRYGAQRHLRRPPATATLEQRARGVGQRIRSGMDQLGTVTLAIDKSRGDDFRGFRFVLEIAARPETNLAEAFNVLAPAESRFPEEALEGTLGTAVVALALPKERLARLDERYKARVPRYVELLQKRGVEVTAELLEEAGRTFYASGLIEAYVGVDSDEGRPTVFGAIAVEETEPLDALLEKYAAAGWLELKRDVDRAEGMPIHQITFNPSLARRLRSHTAYVCLDEGAFWWGVGERGLPRLKELVRAVHAADKRREAPPIQLKLDLREVLKLVAQEGSPGARRAAHRALKAVDEPICYALELRGGDNKLVLTTEVHERIVPAALSVLLSEWFARHHRRER
jgi:hypothetical protein